MAKFLIDNNLPHYFSLWRTEDYVFQRDLNPASPNTDHQFISEKWDIVLELSEAYKLVYVFPDRIECIE